MIQWSFILNIACHTEPETVSVDDIIWNGKPLTVALEEISKSGTATGAVQTKGSDTTGLEKRIGLLEERVDRIEIVISELQSNGIGHSQLVNYDPRATKLSAKNVQEALTELENRLSETESRVLDDLGPPGQGLFNVGKEERGKRGGAGGKGPGGPPGQGGGPPGQGGGPPGQGGGPPGQSGGPQGQSGGP